MRGLATGKREPFLDIFVIHWLWGATGFLMLVFPSARANLRCLALGYKWFGKTPQVADFYTFSGGSHYHSSTTYSAWRIVQPKFRLKKCLPER